MSLDTQRRTEAQRRAEVEYREKREREDLQHASEMVADSYFIEVADDHFSSREAQYRNSYWDKPAQKFPQFAPKITELRDRVRKGREDVLYTYSAAREQFQGFEGEPAITLLSLLTLSYAIPDFGEYGKKRFDHVYPDERFKIKSVAELLKLQLNGGGAYNNLHGRLELPVVIGSFLSGKLGASDQYLQSLKHEAAAV